MIAAATPPISQKRRMSLGSGTASATIPGWRKNALSNRAADDRGQAEDDAKDPDELPGRTGLRHLHERPLCNTG